MNVITLQLDHMAYGGDAIGRFEGKAIFVPGGIADELVQVEIVEDHDRFARARLIDVLEASPDRVTPRCPHFGFDSTSCGGCHWQHLAYEAQLRFKAQIVREQFERIGRIAGAVVHAMLPSPQVWAYRNHVRFSTSADGSLGFQAAKSNRVVPIEVCYIVEAPILAYLQSSLIERKRDGEIAGRRDSGTAGEHDSILSGEVNSQNSPRSRRTRVSETTNQRDNESAKVQINFIDDQIDVRLSNLKFETFNFQLSPDSFFQVNSSLIGALVDQVLLKLDPKSHETILDAYCGVGLFTRFIAPQADRVIGIESSPSAIHDAKQNLREFTNVKLYRGLVEKVLPTLDDKIDAAVVDPPRAGCGPQTIRALIDHRVQRIVYVSCDPSTLARDARQLIDGGYRLIEVQPIDLFPQTYHIENVALFSK
jgi:23S rRNA (uracil1939-C5)-methyltransferase